MSVGDALRVLKCRLFLQGHTLDEIDNLSLDFIGDLLAYQIEENKAKAYVERRNRVLTKTRR